MKDLIAAIELLPEGLDLIQFATFPSAGERYRYRVVLSGLRNRRTLETYAYGKTVGEAMARAIHHHEGGEATDALYWQGNRQSPANLTDGASVLAKLGVPL
jgi:hypothetical protein